MNYLILASSFNRFAGPNNHLLDLCNYLYGKLNLDLRLVTHKTDFHADFLKCINFPLLPVLVGGTHSGRVHRGTRLVYTPMNTRLIKKITESMGISRAKIFVNSSIDTLFEAYWATKRKVATGYNVLFNRNSFLFNLMDHLATKHMIGKIVAHTEFQKRLYLKIGIEKEKISVIPHCIDTNRILKLTNTSRRKISPEGVEKPIIFYGGRLTIEKGIKELLDCYQHVSEQISTTLVLVGDGPLRHWVFEKKREIERTSKRCKIDFLAGWQPPQVLLSKMLDADVVVLPSYHEMFPIVLLEAMCLKKAIVSTNLGGTREMITNRANGLLINPRNMNELRTALLELVTDSKFRRRLGTNAFQTSQEKYDVSVVAPKIIHFLEDS